MESVVFMETRKLVVIRELALYGMLIIAIMEAMQTYIPIEYTALFLAVLAIVRVMVQFSKDQNAQEQ